ncbi:MAG: cobalamin-dependent protein [Candidatus Methanomethylophilaceae archaeon]
MENNEKILEDLKVSIETWNPRMAESATRAAIEAGLSPRDIVDKGLGRGMEVVGRQFDEAKIFLPHVVAASKSMEAALKILAPFMGKGDTATKGTVVMGTVEGDIHEIGKNVCTAMLRGAGYKVIDLGPDVSPDAFVKAALENDAKIVGGSALMTTTLMVQKDLVNLIKEEKLDIKTIFGGAPCSKSWVDSIGGDGYSASGAEIVSLVDSLLMG